MKCELCGRKVPLQNEPWVEQPDGTRAHLDCYLRAQVITDRAGMAARFNILLRPGKPIPPPN